MPISCLYAIERARMNFRVVVVAAPTAIVLFNYPLSLLPFLFLSTYFLSFFFFRIWSKARHIFRSNDIYIREMRTYYIIRCIEFRVTIEKKNKNKIDDERNVYPINKLSNFFQIFYKYIIIHNN